MTELARFFSPPAGHYFLFGPRGTGKTTWLRRAYPDALRLDLLAPDLERQLTARPERFRELVSGARKAEHVVVDEVQRAPAS
jgi:predicted AAA+ superfamily ATPase